MIHPKRRQMTLRAFSLGFALLLAANARAEDAPKFADYPGAAVYNGRNAAPVIATPDARLYRTKIREGVRDTRPNFDGHYIIVQWGCGTQCLDGAIVDAITGKVVSLPVVEAAMRQDAPMMDYHIDSRLIVANGFIGEGTPIASHYFEFDGTRLKPVTTIARPELDLSAPPAKKPQ